MMIKHIFFLTVGIMVYCLGCYLFYCGFLPTKTTIVKSVNQYKGRVVTAKYTHLVIMVIDALRVDFVFGEEGKWSNNMPFLRGQISANKTFSFRSKAKPPTVTMPRLKALTTGAASDFKDIFSNVASAELVTDSIINQFHLGGKQIIFFGDDTWLKLFPNKFLRKDGTHSFYVSDYTEVDDNVTRHLDIELKNFDWHVMILHYLGLDHIGHLSGPSSPLIGPKLLEMDQVIRKISNALVERDGNGNHTLFLITGDHGMSDAGSHGGASYQELFSPLIFLDRTQGESFNNEIVHQLDIASTIAFLFGLPIPINSIGHPIPSLLSSLSNEELTLVTQQIACQLSSVSDGITNKTLLQYVEDICYRDHRRNGINITIQLSEDLQCLSPQYSNTNMILGIIVMLIGCALVLYIFPSLLTSRQYIQSWIYCNIPEKVQQINEKATGFLFFFQAIGLVCLPISFCSSSFVEEEQYIWYYFIPSYFILVVILCKPQRTNLILLLLCLLRITCAWNRTGVKWIGLDDLGDWFTQDGNNNLFLGLLVLLLTMTFFMQFSAETMVGKSLYLSCYFCILVYHISYKKALFFQYNSEITLYSAQLVYAHVILITILKCLSYINNCRTVLTLLSLIILKLENIPWFLLTIITEELFTKKIMPCLLLEVHMTDWQLYFLFFGLSKFSYFSQGKSNSLSTIDISAGMIGFQGYYPILSDIITFIATYCGQLFWLASFLDYVKSVRSPSPSSMSPIVSATVYQLIEGLSLCTIIFIQRYHLFVWSVFAPRYLYLLASTFLTMILVTFAIVKLIFTTPCMD